MNNAPKHIKDYLAPNLGSYDTLSKLTAAIENHKNINKKWSSVPFIPPLKKSSDQGAQPMDIGAIKGGKDKGGKGKDNKAKGGKDK